MDYHCHITVPSFGSMLPKGWKETTILLEQGSSEVHDLMYTRHFRVGAHGVFSEKDIVKECLNVAREFGGIRVKLEKETGFSLEEVLTPSRYMEHHVRIPSEKAPLPETWRRSRNPKSVDGNGVRSFFYTKRSRQGNVAGSLLEVLRDLEGVKDLPLLDVKHELVVLDSSPDHDSWWA